jgi:hypothetical protein
MSEFDETSTDVRSTAAFEGNTDISQRAERLAGVDRGARNVRHDLVDVLEAWETPAQ